MKPEIAIIEPNTLTALGLRTILEEMLPAAIVRVFPTFARLTDDTPDEYAHYFVSSQVYFEHTAFFLERRRKTIVLAAGETPLLNGLNTLNLLLPQDRLVKAILDLQRRGHERSHPAAATAAAQGNCQPTGQAGRERARREAEVLVLSTRGLINKEIAEKLNISLTTVITHRKNITEKLGIKSVSGLAIYAVMHGYVEADRI